MVMIMVTIWAATMERVKEETTSPIPVVVKM